ncbi:MAG: radical SAM protein, partial [Bacteroidales bacterium]|nr:radical SAM protein [Bacteroidales bacterium]
MPTHNCNCECTYCYIPDNERNKKSDHSYLRSVVKDFMDNLEKYNYNQKPEIRFIGGEPYLDINFIIEISNLFLERFKKGKIIINTNGTLISKEKLESINYKNRERFIHIISLDGIEEVHNERRISKNGQNSFNQTVGGINLLKSINMPVYINMVLDEFSIARLNDFMVYLKSELRINELSVSLLYDLVNPIS